MADIDDVLNAIVTIAAQQAYPNGTGAASITGTNIRVFAGWPDPDTLNADLAAGNVAVSVFPTPSERDMTRYPMEWQDNSVNAAKLTLTISGQTVTVGGTILAGEAAVVTVNGTPYSYGVTASDTLNSVAAGLAALIPAATASGAVVTITNAHALTGMVSTAGTSIKEVGRQERVIQVTIWAPDPTKRTTVAKAIDAAMRQQYRITLADDTVAHVSYRGSPITDMLSKQRLFRRDLLYGVEYATTITQVAQVIAGAVLNATPQQTTGTPITQPVITVSTL